MPRRRLDGNLTGTDLADVFDFGFNALDLFSYLGRKLLLILLGLSPMLLRPAIVAIVPLPQCVRPFMQPLVPVISHSTLLYAILLNCDLP